MLERAAAGDGYRLQRDSGFAQGGDDLLRGDFTAFEELLQQMIIKLGNGLEQFFAILESPLHEILWNLVDVELGPE